MHLPNSSWLLRRALAAPRLRLFCFSYAGGNASEFLDWQAAFAPTIEICALQLPGRGRLIHEPPWRDRDALVAALVDIVAAEATLPIALFGHSLGALLAFEVARQLPASAAAKLVRLFASGSESPRVRSTSAPLHGLDDDAFIEALGRLNGTPPEVLEHRELMQLVLPMLRADFALAEEYVYREGPLLRVPITVFGGRADTECTAPNVEAWLAETTAGGRLVWFDGGHFFLQPERAAVIRRIREDLADSA
jgi:surfactin synthase thioesterase subunit